jgi:hypothetical protein
LKKFRSSAAPYLVASAVHWRQHFDYLTSTAERENPAAFKPQQKAMS